MLSESLRHWHRISSSTSHGPIVEAAARGGPGSSSKPGSADVGPTMPSVPVTVTLAHGSQCFWHSICYASDSDIMSHSHGPIVEGPGSSSIGSAGRGYARRASVPAIDSEDLVFPWPQRRLVMSPSPPASPGFHSDTALAAGGRSHGDSISDGTRIPPGNPVGTMPEIGPT